MAIPQFLSYSYGYTFSLASNSEDLMNCASSALINGGWSWGGGEYPLVVMYSPFIIGIKQFRLVITAPNETQLVVSAQDDQLQGINVTGAGGAPYVSIDEPPPEGVTTFVNAFAGPNYFFIDSFRSAENECLGVWLLDNAPSPALDDPMMSFGGTQGPNVVGEPPSGSARNWNSVWAREPYEPRRYLPSQYGVAKQPMGGSSNRFRFTAMSGASLFEPWDVSIGGYLLGRVPNCLLCDYNATPGSLLTVPIDTGVTKRFMVLGLKPYSTYGNRVCVKAAE